MSLQEKIYLKVKEINDPKLLQLILQFVEFIKSKYVKEKGNRDAILKHAGFMSDEDAEEMRKIIDEEFNNIEGDW